jgi:putative ABC transport system permease protein
MIMRWNREELLIVLVLALGIGGNAAIFTLMNAAFLSPLPYRDAERLVSVNGIVFDKRVAGGINRYDPSISEFLEIRKRSHVLEDMAFMDHLDFQLTGIDEPVRVFAARVSASFFPLLGVQPSLGRTFSPDENTPGRTHVVLLSDNFWRTRMGGQRDIVGQTLHLDGEASTVVGVLPPGFSFDYPTLGSPEPADIYVPFPMSDSSAPESGLSGRVDHVRIFARLRAGSDLAQWMTSFPARLQDSALMRSSLAHSPCWL